MSQVVVEQQSTVKKTSTSATAAVAKKAISKPTSVKTEKVVDSVSTKAKTKKVSSPKDVAPAPVPESVVVNDAPVIEEPTASITASTIPSESSEEESKASGEKLSRRRKNFNQLLTDIELLNSTVEQYIAEHKDIKSTSELSKFLKSMDKGLKKVRVQVQKFGKQKTHNASVNSHSGFQKPVRISSQVADFTGWDESQPRARVEVTNFVCDYIRCNSLQSPNDKRVILADEKLASLLEYNREIHGDLTYATIQKLLAKHYTSIVPVSVE